MVNDTKKRWTDYRCKEYKENVDFWKFQEDHFSTKSVIKEVRDNAHKLRKYIGDEYTVYVDDQTGEVTKHTVKNNIPREYRFSDPFKDYLRRRPKENLSNYIDRCYDADYDNHPKRIVKTFVGIISAVENAVFWQPEDTSTGLRNHSSGDVGGKLESDADGHGTGWNDKWEYIIHQLLKYDKGYLVVSGKDDTARLTFIEPKRVLNKRYNEDGDLVELLIYNERVQQNSLKEQAKRIEEYQLYTVDGVEKYVVQKNEDGKEQLRELEDEAIEYSFYNTKSKDQKVIPIIEMEMFDDFGFTLTKKSNQIFQKQSETTHRFRMMMETLLGVDVEDEGFRELKKSLLEGGSVVQGAIGFESPSGEPVKIGLDLVQDMIEDLYTTLFLEYGNSARQKSATEIRQDYQKGIVAILNTIQTKMESIQNRTLWLIEQIYYPNKPSLWGQAYVQRGTDFTPKNEEQAVKLIKETFFDMQDVPLPASVSSRLVMQMLDMLEIKYEEDEIRREAEEDELTRLQEQQEIVPDEV